MQRSTMTLETCTIRTRQTMMTGLTDSKPPVCLNDSSLSCADPDDPDDFDFVESPSEELHLASSYRFCHDRLSGPL